MLALSELQFNVAQLLKEATGATRSYAIETEVNAELDDVEVVSPLVGQVDFLRTGPHILVTGQLQTTIQKSCGRCLTDFTRPVILNLEEEFYPVINIFTGAPVPKPAQAEAANLIDEQNILDLSEVVWQELVVMSEGIRYCRPDCKGLCPHCGQDRNIAPCDCAEDQIDPRWAGLQALKID
ncbi:MAG: DUF177 domain-containing protein [Anaerolineae bacterium]|nr:DUF177 domain-containing protein [Anaerolineae bacterium]